MSRDEALAVVHMPVEQAVDFILALAQKAEKYDQLCGQVTPSTPSGMVPPYLKPKARKRRKRPGRKNGHKGACRSRPEQVDHFKDHTLECCPDCQTPVEEPISQYKRYTEDIPPIEKSQTTEHSVHGYWCPKCKKIVFAPVTDALPRATIGLRLVVFTAWLHYLVGISVNNIVKILSVFCKFKISAGGLTQAWRNLAVVLEPVYTGIGQRISKSAILCADETGWRLNGVTHWLWCFATKELSYYLITKSRGSPVIKEVLGAVFRGILICDFWGAYNRISALAKQRCFYHLFTELGKVDKTNSSPQWKSFRKKLLRILRDAIRLSERKSHLDKEHYERLKRKLYNRLDQFLKNDHKEKDSKRLTKRLRRHRHELFTFLEYPNVSPYNNHAEQQMRKPVLTRKVSQQNRSEQGAQTHAVLMSLFRSAELHGEDPIENLFTLAQTIISKGTKPEQEMKLAA
jgi:transposase